VKWESFEKHIEVSSASVQVVDGHSVQCVNNINYGNARYYEESDDYHYNDGQLRKVIVIGWKK